MEISYSIPEMGELYSKKSLSLIFQDPSIESVREGIFHTKHSNSMLLFVDLVTTGKESRFHFNDYFNFTYTNDNNPLATSWTITIPQTPIVNCYLASGCDTCSGWINSYVTTYNSDINQLASFIFTTNVGAKYADPVRSTRIGRTVSGGTSGSYCFSMT